MLFYFLSFCPGMIALIVFLKLRVAARRVPATIAKAITSLFFILCAAATVLAQADKNPTVVRYGTLIIMGLVFGLLGDIWLDLKYAFPEYDRHFTFSGFISFAIGHVFFLTAMFVYFKPSTKLVIIAAVIAVLFGFAVAFGGKLLKLEYGIYKAISGIYGAELVFVTAIALMSVITAAGGIRAPQITMLVGAILFLISDLILSNTYFGTGWDRPVHIIANHVSYYLAQFVIAASVLVMAQTGFGA